MKNLNQNEKVFLAIYSGWALLHLVLLSMGWEGAYHRRFWLFFEKHDWENTIEEAYDLSEFLVYVGAPAVAFFIYRAVNSYDKK